MYTRYAQHTVIWFIRKQTIGGSSISCWFVCNLFQNVSIGEDYCGEFDFNNPIDGPFVMMSEETIKLNTRASSLTVAVTYNGDTVAFVGTQSGELIKVKPLNMYWERKTISDTSPVLNIVI